MNSLKMLSVSPNEFSISKDTISNNKSGFDSSRSNMLSKMSESESEDYYQHKKKQLQAKYFAQPIKNTKSINKPTSKPFSTSDTNRPKIKICTPSRYCNLKAN